jgi:hypothetical protein
MSGRVGANVGPSGRKCLVDRAEMSVRVGAYAVLSGKRPAVPGRTRAETSIRARHTQCTVKPVDTSDRTGPLVTSRRSGEVDQVEAVRAKPIASISSGDSCWVADQPATFFAYVRESLRPWMDVSTTPSPPSSSSAKDHERCPPMSPKASYLTTATCRRAVAASDLNASICAVVCSAVSGVLDRARIEARERAPGFARRAGSRPALRHAARARAHATKATASAADANQLSVVVSKGTARA